MTVDKAQLQLQLRQVFIERGFDGATLAHLAHAAGLSKATLYHHFPAGKSEMADTLIRQAIADLEAKAFSQLAGKGGDFDAFLSGFSTYITASQGQCILQIFALHGTASAEIVPLQNSIAEQFGHWHQALARTFETRGNKPGKSARMAHELISQIYGAVVNAKLQGDPSLFDVTLKRIQKRYRIDP